jgi:signal transduction histidine kinase
MIPVRHADDGMEVKRWWADTLFKRLFLLMWLALVVSHLCAFFSMQYFHGFDGGPGPAGSLPVLPSLPPGGLMPHSSPPAHAPDIRAPRPGGPDDRGPPGGPADRPPPPPDFGGPGRATGGDELPINALWLDYFVRFVVIGVAAWGGARWLSSPMRKLARASAALGRSIKQRQLSPQLDEQHGTLEVRQTAQVFNTMAHQLHAQFDAQGLLMAAISHDLRTPLARLRLRLEQLGSDDTQVQRCIADVREMDQLIGSVLGMLRDQHASEARERIDARSLVQSLADDLAEQGQPVAVQETGDTAASPIVLARPTALKRVVGNLIGNAVRHGGSARISMTVRDAEFRLAIDDDGPGIPPHQLEAVFQPFYRADASRGSGMAGSGLGLYIARDLVEREGGRITLDNRPGGGLCAAITLPLA